MNFNDDIRHPFSKRHGFGPDIPAIKIWHDAPERFRAALLNTAKISCNLSPSKLRDIVCGVLHERPDPSNWAEYPNIWNEVQQLVYDCEWFRVYDIAEALAQYLGRAFHPGKDIFECELNDCFREMGIGWKMIESRIQARGEDDYEKIVEEAKSELNKADMPTAQSEISEALNDLSRRPQPDLSGAVHHAMAALECVSRTVTGQSKATLGEIVTGVKNPLPKPLDEAVKKAWGYASENARHGREERILSRAEAHLIVGLSSSVISYLLQKSEERP
ncbi:AbiJ-NTD4 domain-containing protein [Desulfococcus sp.]|uniref:AbiJ-NTD4 domain-containing protein n=1 Tax=Desulfococcus sp. TaxID=2025834 RepID=UPI00359357E7